MTSVILKQTSSLVELARCCDMSEPSGSGFAAGHRGLAAGDMAKRCANGHTYTCRVTLSQHVSCHHFASNKQVWAGGLIEMYSGLQVGLQAQVGEGDARP